MPPARQEHVDILDERTRAVIRETAREVIAEHVASCPIVAEFRTLHVDVYGPPGEKDEHPGLMGDVSDLKRSRRNLRWGLSAVWALIVSVAGALAWPVWQWLTHKNG